MKKIVIIGASGHGKVVADIARLNGYDEIVFLDDDESINNCGRYYVKGKSSDAEYLARDNYDVFVAIGNAKTRERIRTSLKGKANIVTLIHPKSVIADDVVLGKGTVIMAGAIVNSSASIGDGCIVNTGASVDHDDIIGDYVHVSVGTHLAGTVVIGNHTWIGAGAVVSNNVSICDDCIIGAGAVVVKDINKCGTYIGVPAKEVKAK